MSILVFFLLGLAVAAAIIYPLLPGQRGTPQTATVTDEQIDRAVRDLRRSRQHGPACPTCGHGYQAGDRFCVHCAGSLPGSQAATAGPACPSCGSPVKDGDRFCARCGHSMPLAELPS